MGATRPLHSWYTFVLVFDIYRWGGNAALSFRPSSQFKGRRRVPFETAVVFYFYANWAAHTLKLPFTTDCEWDMEYTNNNSHNPQSQSHLVIAFFWGILATRTWQGSWGGEDPQCLSLDVMWDYVLLSFVSKNKFFWVIVCLGFLSELSEHTYPSTHESTSHSSGNGPRRGRRLLLRHFFDKGRQIPSSSSSIDDGRRIVDFLPSPSTFTSHPHNDTLTLYTQE